MCIRDRVIVNGNVLHTTMKVLAEDCRYREIKYYADGDFKKWLEQEEPDANKDRYLFLFPGYSFIRRVRKITGYCPCRVLYISFSKIDDIDSVYQLSDALGLKRK